jgi:hypothetical protein
MKRLFLAILLASGVAGLPFLDFPYEDLLSRALALRGSFASVSSAKELLGLEVIKSVRASQCRSEYYYIFGYHRHWGHSLHANLFQGARECSPSIIRVSHAASLQSDVSRPQVLISGEIHGDERVVRL